MTKVFTSLSNVVLHSRSKPISNTFAMIWNGDEAMVYDIILTFTTRSVSNIWVSLELVKEEKSKLERQCGYKKEDIHT
jgi:hypothetical protein